MNKILFFLITFNMLSVVSKAQEDAVVKLSSVSLNIVQPKVSANVNEIQVSNIGSKVENMLTESGVASADFSNGFAIEPKFIVTNTQKSAGGMRSVVLADCSFTLTVKQQSSGTVFSQYSQNIKGSGFNEGEAITNAVSQIEEGNEKAIAFVSKAKEKIIIYFKQNCDILIQKSEKERMQKKYESALSILLTIPEEADGCYGKAQAKAAIVFKELQNFQCKTYIQNAQAYAAAKDFDNALETLSWVDPTGGCKDEAKLLIKKIEAETTDDKKKRWQFVFKTLDGEIEVGKARAAAMSNLTLFWLKQHSTRTVIVD